MLFFEIRLSKNQDLSCNSCHKLDGLWGRQSAHLDRASGPAWRRNAPTVYNAAGFFAQFWDGRMETVEQQALGPILEPDRDGASERGAGVRVLKSIPEYRAAFKSAFPGENDPVTFDNVGRAIGAFERRLTTPARWDDYLRGKAGGIERA